MPDLPRIHVVGREQVKDGHQYTLWIGRKDGEIVCLALSPLKDILTVPKLLLEVDAEFQKTTAVMDVYTDPRYPRLGVCAQFWSTKHQYAYIEEPLDPFLNDNTEERWRQILGVPVSFYPFGGPSDKPENFPDFPKK